MNLGIYFRQASSAESIIENINKKLSDGALSDAAIFYDSIGPISNVPNFGLFNSTDIWAFTGNLITTCSQTTMTCKNIVNKFKHYYYYNPLQEKDALQVIQAVSDSDVKVICASDEDAKELVRITGVEPEAVIEDFEIEKIIEAVR
tara:strand:- start:1706 stop:2143 length:438 start_codon:yes stop_codon:yes gene_type:complete